MRFPEVLKRYVLPAVCIFPAAGLLVWYLAVGERVRLENPRPTPIIEDRYGTFLTEGLEEYDQLGYWDMPEELSEKITAAILAVEDRRFFSHGGMDLRSTVRALVNNLGGGPVQGASTIAMQVARLQRPAARTLVSKVSEAFTAGRLIRRFGREAVLRHYMKIVPLGHQIHGFAYASRRYFQKPVEDLTWAEAALLAALPKAPSQTDLFNPMSLGRAKQRAELILDLLHEAGKLDAGELAVAKDLLAGTVPPHRELRPVEALHFIERLLEQESLYRESYSKPIRSSLDLDIQRRTILRLREFIEKNSPFGARNAACIVLDRETGEILAYVGSAGYFDKETSGSINYAYTPRSSGSILKPFMFAYGLDTGVYTSGSIVADIPLHWMEPKGQYVVENFDGEYLGPMLYGSALANSRNITAVRVLDRLGPTEVFDLFRQFGFHDGSRPWEYYGFGLILGGLYVTLEDVARAYGYLAADGKDYVLNWTIPGSDAVRPVRDERGIIPAGLLEESSVRLVTGYLAEAVRRLPGFPRLSALEFPFPVAVKTGTSQGYRDAWTAAYSRRYVVAAWTGDPDNARMDHVAGSTVAELVHSLFLDIQAEDIEGFNAAAFPPPRNAVAVLVSPYSGKLARPETPGARVEYFVRGTEPVEYCDVYQPFSVDRRNGRPAGPDTSPEDVVLRFFPVLPPEYDAWAEDHGLSPPEAAARPEKRATVSVRYPPDGARFIIDPGRPRQFQTVGFEVMVEPRISEIVWYVDGEEYGRADYPYTIRWPLTEGKHLVQVKFPNAFVESKPVAFEVLK